MHCRWELIGIGWPVCVCVLQQYARTLNTAVIRIYKCYCSVFGLRKRYTKMMSRKYGFSFRVSVLLRNADSWNGQLVYKFVSNAS